MTPRVDDARIQAVGAPEPAPVGSLLSTIVEAVERYHEASRAQVAAVHAAAQRSFDARIAELTERLSVLDQRTAGLVGWADGLDTRLATVADQQARTLERLADVEARAERLSGHLADAVERLGQLATQSTEGFTTLTVRADSLRRGEEALTAQLASLAAEVTARDREQSAVVARVDSLATQVEGVTADRLHALDELLNSAVGEATIARIELDRMSQRVAERFDTIQVRVGELESQMTEQLDVGTAVQLERLDELERAVMELDPDALLRKA